MCSAKRSDHAKSAGPVSQIDDEFLGVDRRVPFIIGLFQGKLQMIGAAYAAPYQDHPAKPNSYPDHHPNRRDGRQTEHQADKQRCAGKGARASLLGTIRRRDGRLQVTYRGRPLYYYAHEGAGEVRCHNVDLNGGLWWVIGADGKRRP